jgi:RNA polymerase sigma-70 factor (ECF subfamily)
VANNTDDTSVIRRFLQGDIFAFSDIVRDYQDRVYTLCVYMLRDTRDAQEAAQDVFIKAYRALPDFEPRSSLYTWLYSIAARTCLDYRRKAFRMSVNQPLPDDLSSPGPSPEKEYQSKETAQTLQQALQRLPEKLRVVVVLREIEELSYEEIAKVLNVSSGTVKSRISRAREELRRLLLKKL